MNQENNLPSLKSTKKIKKVEVPSDPKSELMENIPAKSEADVSSNLTPVEPILTQPVVAATSNNGISMAFMLIGGLAIIGAIAIFAYVMGATSMTIKKETNLDDSSPITKPNDSKKESPIVDNTKDQDIVEVDQDTNGFRFFAPIKTKLDIFNTDIPASEMMIDPSMSNMFLVGEKDDTKAYLVSIPSIGPGFSIPYIFLIDKSGQKMFVASRDDFDSEVLDKYISPSIKLISSYDGLPEFPGTFSANNANFSSPSSLLKIGDEVSKEVDDRIKISSIKGLSFYRTYNMLGYWDTTGEKQIEVPGMYSRQTYLFHETIKFGKFYSLELNFMSDNSIPLVTWIDGRSKEDVYTNVSDVCGGYSYGFNVIKAGVLDESKLLYVGETKQGEKLYQLDQEDAVFANNSNLLKSFYMDYMVGRNYEGSEAEYVSYEDFIKAPNHFLYKDSLGDWIIFKNEKYAPLAECGKPVVYLYPTEKTNVSVKVGAKVRISDPEYGNGWNVIADPSGKLTLGGKVYDSLFWEGKGNGEYPNVKEFGVVVKKADVEKTLWNHLKLLGLNQKESNDFMEFWLSKMPNTPYVRLTWLGTSEMNTLAPLEVSPKPDTMIRIFLDFEGLYSSVSLKEQNLVSQNRNGFTLVEWGGLLR